MNAEGGERRPGGHLDDRVDVTVHHEPQRPAVGERFEALDAGQIAERVG